MARDWREARLGEVVTLKRGYDLPTATRNGQGGVPVVSSSGVSGYHDEPKVQPPGVVTGRYGTVGDVFYLEEPFWPLNTSLYVQSFHGNHPRFVYYFLQSIDYTRYSDKTGVPGINRNDIHRIRVAVPPLPEPRGPRRLRTGCRRPRRHAGCAMPPDRHPRGEGPCTGRGG